MVGRNIKFKLDQSICIGFISQQFIKDGEQITIIEIMQSKPELHLKIDAIVIEGDISEQIPRLKSINLETADLHILSISN